MTQYFNTYNFFTGATSQILTTSDNEQSSTLLPSIFTLKYA